MLFKRKRRLKLANDELKEKMDFKLYLFPSQSIMRCTCNRDVDAIKIEKKKWVCLMAPRGCKLICQTRLKLKTFNLHLILNQFLELVFATQWNKPNTWTHVILCSDDMKSYSLQKHKKRLIVVNLLLCSLASNSFLKQYVTHWLDCYHFLPSEDVTFWYSSIFLGDFVNKFFMKYFPLQHNIHQMSDYRHRY